MVEMDELAPKQRYGPDPAMCLRTLKLLFRFLGWDLPRWDHIWVILDFDILVPASTADDLLNSSGNKRGGGGGGFIRSAFLSA